MTSDKKDQKFAAEMKAWMMIQVIGQTSVNFLNVKKLKKEMTEHIDTLRSAVLVNSDISAEDAARDDGGTVTGADMQAKDTASADESAGKQESFAEYFIDTCLTSKTYRTAVFGTMSMSDAGAATRIARDIIEVTETIPKRFGLVAEARPVFVAMIKAFQAKVENSASILNEMCIIL